MAETVTIPVKVIQGKPVFDRHHPPSSDLIASANAKPAFAFATLMPCWITSAGRRGSASATRFCV